MLTDPIFAFLPLILFLLATLILILKGLDWIGSNKEQPVAPIVIASVPIAPPMEFSSMDSTGLLRRGEMVVLESSEGAISRWVWEDCGDAVLLCSERQYQALTNGWNAPTPIGFPKTSIRKQ